MPRSRQILCLVYAVTALVALAGTWSQNVAYFKAGEDPLTGFVLATGRFWVETLATPASTSITVDLGLLLVPLFALMILEARRLGIRFVWLYIVLGALVAISVTFPLFLIARERRIAERGGAAEALGFTRPDLVALCGVGAALTVFTFWTIGR